MLAAAILAGCGAGSQQASTLDRGRAIYRRACTDCHTLDGHEHGTDGGDLALGDLDVRDLASFTRAMPVSPPLDAADVHAVAEYIHSVAARLSSSPH